MRWRLGRMRTRDRRSAARSEEGRFGTVLDGVSDSALLAFAVWTLIAYGGMVTHAPVSVLTLVWVVTLPVLVWLRIALGRRVEHPSPEDDHGNAGSVSWARGAVVVAVGTATGAALAAAFR